MVLPDKTVQTGPPLELVAPAQTAPETPVPLSSPDYGPLGEARTVELATALHARWHRPHYDATEAKNIECARLAGAFDDAEAIAPLIASWLREAEASGRTALLEAAGMADRIHRIGTTASRDVHPADLDWWGAEPQSSLRDACLDSHYSSRPLTAVATWLRALAGGRPA